MDAMVHTLKRDDGDDATESERLHFASETRIEFVDLNGDGRPEVTAQANGFGPCGDTGNCALWVALNPDQFPEVRSAIISQGARTTLNGKIKDAVETLDKDAGVLKRDPFHEKSLVQKQPGCVLGDGIIGACK